MTKKKPPQQEGIAEAIRAEIAKIPSSELVYAKPSRILPALESAGLEITPSVRSMTSKLLAKAKNKEAPAEQGEIVSVAEAVAESQKEEDRRELAMRLVEACGGDFGLARAELARLEQFARTIRGA